MICYICNSEKNEKVPGSVRGESDISVLKCANCGLVFLSSHSHIDDDHYKDSGMHINKVPDIDTWLTETKKDDERRFEFLKSKIKNKKILDFGCGIGGYLEMAQKISSLAKGIELEKAIQPSFKNRGLSVYSDLNAVIETGEKWDLITLFHVVEHLRDPILILEDLSKILEKDGEIIIEVPNADDALLSLYKNKGFQNFVYWSQHVFVFNKSTMNALIKKANLKVNWFEHIQRYPLSNHLYWLANGKPGGHQVWNFLDDNVLNQKYEKQLKSKGITDTILLSIGLK